MKPIFDPNSTFQGQHSSEGGGRCMSGGGVYGMPARDAESQQPEAWPASIYGHLRESADLGVSVIKELFILFYISFV